ncbi:MAG: 5-formyltetrahydrofolate cyclo-ligase [Candidatus Bathyarchaeota archaeon]|nr:5-formyltetrahydrofolate cyclo-ligase [Candidatus Bathyarchaeota archaeon]
MMINEILRNKQRLRSKIWSEMEQQGIAAFPLPCRGRIPNFVGAAIAAEKLRQLDEWKKARVIFVGPDSPQKKVRENTLKDGKVLVIASPKLKRDFIILNPARTIGMEHFASTIKGAFQLGAVAKLEDIPRPDLIVEGSVAVDPHGHRLGKGGGYGDLEIGLLKRVFGDIPVATTVHDIQLVEKVPFGEKDEKISIIVTPTKVIRVESHT